MIEATAGGQVDQFAELRLRAAFSSFVSGLPWWRRWFCSWRALWAAFRREGFGD